MSLTDEVPVLLGPVRIETRFTPTELLVRVFPDEWAIDKFEARPTRAEIAALDAYWIARWTAGGNPAGVTAAWQELTGRVALGRATWLLAGRVPANLADEPAGVPDGTTVLVVVTPQPVAARDRAPTVAYWSAVWRAHSDRRRLRQADAALLDAVGANRANTIRGRRPSGVDASAAVPGDAVLVAFLVLPPVTDLAPQSWTTGARARLLPARFQVLGFVSGAQVLSATGAPVPATLAVSPDPGADDQLAIDQDTGALHVPEDLRWLTDFDRAVEVGMGLRIPLDDRTRNGLDQLIVLGLRDQSDPVRSGADLAELITRQQRSAAGFSLLPQGTPTNNTEQAPAGQDAADEADAALRATARSALAVTPQWTGKTDGQHFVELLGLDPAVLAGMANADGTDQRDARAANTVLWPATWGSFLQTALHPILDRDAVAQTREFFLRYVSGRGPLPAMRIGRQPYGILPTTAFSRLEWPEPAAHRRGLHRVLTAAAQDWRAATERVARLGPRTGDAHQRLLDILALHPTSAEFHQRYAQSVEDLFNRENLAGRGGTVLSTVDQLGLAAPVRALLSRFGYDGSRADPDLLRRLFVDAQQQLLAPLVDDRPPSETDRIREYTADHRSYLRWLADAAGTDLETIRLELGFVDDAVPPTTLYLLARHAVLLGWADAARNLAIAAGVADPGDLGGESPFIHVKIPVAGQALPSESRFRRLYSPAPAITGSPDRLLVDFLPTVLRGDPATAELAEQVDALGLLADLPTARLERVLAEHLDLATYRLDAWRLGLANERLAELRFGPTGDAPPRKGLHLGAYGWLEDVRPGESRRTPVQLTGELAQIFAGPTPLLHDPHNGGFVHAPSPGHARTAAVLRAGYLANAAPDNPGVFAVNLSSERVRVALSLLDGLRQGQSLGALLGYRLERGLHDRHDQAEVDRFINALRQRFPLRAGKIAQTATDPDQPVAIEQVEARNVVDGLALVRHVTRNDVPDVYPFGLDHLLPSADPAQTEAITTEVRRLLVVNDALADLAVAEGTHQAMLGNVERASATLDAYAKEGFPGDPAVVRSPRSGSTLTHRLGLRLTPGLSPNHGRHEGRNNPRAQAEPAVNDWLPSLLPEPSDVAVKVTWTDPRNGVARSRTVSLDDLDLDPIDLLWTVRPAGTGAMTELDDRIVAVVVDKDHPRPDAELTIRYTERVPEKVTIFELSPLVAALRTLLTTARPLRTSDLMPTAGRAGVDRAVDDNVSLSRDRIEAVRDSLDELADDVSDYRRHLTRLYPAVPRTADIVDEIDDLLAGYADLVRTAAGFGLLRSGWGELIAWRRQVHVDVMVAVSTVAGRMTGALAEADALIAAEDALPNGTADSERLRLLSKAERLLTTNPTNPRPTRPNQLRSTVKSDRRDFDRRLDDLRDLADSDRSTLSGLLHQVQHELPLTDIDPAGLDLTPFLDRVVGFGRELLNRARTLQAEVAGRLAAAGAALAEYDAAVTGPDRIEAGMDALRTMLGPDVLVVPEFTPPAEAATDWRRAFDDRGKLLRHLTRPPIGRDFPVDDWLHGLARVREMPRLWERATMLSDALRGDGFPDPEHDVALVPIQLPFRPNDHWLGLEFAAGSTPAEDRLLFTAHYAKERLADDRVHCGLLFDEWTEVIPAERESTSIAVNVDRPDSEPPQAMLLVCPPVRTGAWRQDDLVAAIIETFELARMRAVEPAHLEDTPYVQLLPATLLSATRQPITISTDLAVGTVRWRANND